MSHINTTHGKGGSYLAILENELKMLYEKMCMTMQLSHHTSNLGPGDISLVIFLDPLDIVIESSLE